MWGAFAVLFRFFSVTLLNSCCFVLDHLHLVMPWLSSFSAPIKLFVLDHLYLVILSLFTFFSFQIKNLLWDHLNNILLVRTNMEALTYELNKLKATLKNVEGEIRVQMDGAVMNKVTDQVEEWMKRVKELQLTVESVVDDYNNRSYFYNVYSISTRAVNKLKMVRQETDFIKGVRTYTTAASLSLVQQTPTTPIEFGREMFESKLQEALNFLRDDKDGVLGIWGMGGVGKTTLLEHINNKMAENPSSFGFDKVVFVTASRGSTTLEIQKELMQMLGLPEGGANRTTIFNYLRNKDFAILLDDLWEPQDLKEVGVPLPLGIVGEHKLKRKLILTTRSQRVCSNMDAQRQTINVKCLSPEDARLLFRHNAGVDATIIRLNPRIEELADEVADECDGLPIALITTGRALAKTEPVQVWENALQLLRDSKLSQIPGVNDPLPLLKFSYDYLKECREQECLLHCALWPEDELIPKDELIQCWMGHGLLGESDSIQKVYNNGHTIIDSLVKVCLLENPENDRVKLHDLIRDMALWIARDCHVKNDNKWVVRHGRQVSSAPCDERTWSEVQKMSLTSTSIYTWSSEIQNCPKLTTLILSGNRFLDKSILKHSLALEYLDMSACKGLKEFPIEICGLKKLEYLNLSYTDITSLPEELKKLTNLKYLLLRDTDISSVLVELLPNLVSLKVLDLNGRWNRNSQTSIIDHMACLKRHLVSLSINSYLLSDFEGLVRLSGISITDICMISMKDSTSTSLRVLSPELLGSQNIQFRLKTLDINWLHERIEELVMEEKCRPMTLERLHIACSSGLKEIIWKGVKPMEVFPNLCTVHIYACPQIRNATWTANLPCLDFLNIEDCVNMEQIVFWELEGAKVEESCRAFFPGLKTLNLRSIEKLSSICDRAEASFPSLEYLNVMDCPQLMKLPFQSCASCPKLKKIKADKRWWDKLVLEGNMRDFLDPLLQFH